MSKREERKAEEPVSQEEIPSVFPAGEQTMKSSETALKREPMLSIIETSQYQRFAEVCESCQRHHFIGVCYGAAGVGKRRESLARSQVSFFRGLHFFLGWLLPKRNEGAFQRIAL